jgi:15-cis-phytoene synthase
VTTSLEQSFRYCKQLNRRYGKTYYWSTFALPARKRRYVWSLYGFCRYADDIVDDLGDVPLSQRANALQDLGDRLRVGLATGTSDDPVLAAVVHTARRFDLDPASFERFLAAMTMDLTVSEYRTYGDLLEYMDGSAAVIGEMMLPILEPTSPEAFGRARDLGLAFQLTNFLRDVAEDLDRGRMYIPKEDVERFGADPRSRVVDDAWRALMRFEIERCRALYRSADVGITMLPPTSARCIRAARVLYSEILERIETADYDVFAKRATVPTWRKCAAVVQTSLQR